MLVDLFLLEPLFSRQYRCWL